MRNFFKVRIKKKRDGHNYAKKTLMLSNNVWSVGKRRARRQRKTRKRARSRGCSARLIRRRGRSGRISTSVPTPSHPRGNSRIILHFEDPSLILFSLFLKDIFNKESRLRPRLIRRFSGGRYLQHRSHFNFRSSPFLILCTLTPSLFIRSLSYPFSLFKRERERERERETSCCSSDEETTQIEI